MTSMITLAIGGTLAIIAALITIWIISLRRVVSTNEVHIIQSSRKTVSFGKDQEAGNTYYEWPSWIPLIGIQVIKLPVSVFSLRLRDYEAYDNGRLPFVLDLEAFFRIDNSNIAAQRVAHFQELNGQLTSILQGAARTILASKSIEEIMQGRSEFGIAFTEEVNEQLKAWDRSHSGGLQEVYIEFDRLYDFVTEYIKKLSRAIREKICMINTSSCSQLQELLCQVR